MRIHGGVTAPLRARRAVLSQLEGTLTETRAADLALIVSELVTNSVIHANVAADQTLTVNCTTTEDRLRITVTDPGSRLEPHLRPHGHDTTGGCGLLIVDELSSAWGVGHDSHGSTSVWCELLLGLSAPG